MPQKILGIYAVTPGSIWADLQAHGRTVVVEAIDGQHAVCTTLTNSQDVQRVIDLPQEVTCSNPRDMRGTTHRISLDRFRPIHKGFAFVTATGAHLSSRLTTSAPKQAEPSTPPAPCEHCGSPFDHDGIYSLQVCSWECFHALVDHD